MPFSPSKEFVQALNKTLELCAEHLPIATDCVDCGLEAQHFVQEFQRLCDQATRMKQKFAPMER